MNEYFGNLRAPKPLESCTAILEGLCMSFQHVSTLHIHCASVVSQAETLNSEWVA